MKPDVVRAAEPSYGFRLRIVVVMRVYAGVFVCRAANLAGLLDELAPFDEATDCLVALVFGWVCPAPVCLSSSALDHDSTPEPERAMISVAVMSKWEGRDDELSEGSRGVC